LAFYSFLPKKTINTFYSDGYTFGLVGVFVGMGLYIALTGGIETIPNIMYIRLISMLISIIPGLILFLIIKAKSSKIVLNANVTPQSIPEEELYSNVVKFVKTQKHVTPDQLFTKFDIGIIHAHRIIERLENEGVIKNSEDTFVVTG